MMAYGSYPTYPYYQPYQMQPPAPQPQGRTIEVIPVDTEDDAAKVPVAVGATQVMFARDDSFIAVKSLSVNGQPSFDVYVRRPPAPPAPAFDPGAYVTKEELEERLAALLPKKGAKE